MLCQALGANSPVDSPRIAVSRVGPMQEGIADHMASFNVSYGHVGPAIKLIADARVLTIAMVCTPLNKQLCNLLWHYKFANVKKSLTAVL
jgi:hypothetical protein